MVTLRRENNINQNVHVMKKLDPLFYKIQTNFYFSENMSLDDYNKKFWQKRINEWICHKIKPFSQKLARILSMRFSTHKTIPIRMIRKCSGGFVMQKDEFVFVYVFPIHAECCWRKTYRHIPSPWHTFRYLWRTWNRVFFVEGFTF